MGPVSKKSARLPLASTSQTSVRLPCCAASSASDAAIVVLPTPPLPVTNSSWRSSRSVGMGPTRPAGSAAEADAALVLGAADLDVGDLVDGHADLAALAVGEPQGAAVREGGVDLCSRPRRRRRRRPAWTSSSLGVWVTPMRTSTGSPPVSSGRHPRGWSARPTDARRHPRDRSTGPACTGLGRTTAGGGRSAHRRAGPVPRDHAPAATHGGRRAP